MTYSEIHGFLGHYVRPLDKKPPMKPNQFRNNIRDKNISSDL